MKKKKKWDKEELKTELKEMHRGNILFMMEGKTQEEQETMLSAGPQRKREKAYKQIKSLIEIFYAKEISQGEIKEDIPGPDLVDWLKGLNQAATSQNDQYTMKATIQLMLLVEARPKMVCKKCGGPVVLVEGSTLEALGYGYGTFECQKCGKKSSYYGEGLSKAEPKDAWIDKWADELWAEGGILGKDDARAFIEKLAADLPSRKPEGFPKIICLCGSTRFTELMLIKQWELTKQGAVVLSWCALPDSYFTGKDKAHIGDQEEVKEIVDEVHCRKIDLADEVWILNVGGYIGESTRAELNYAREKGKAVQFLEPEKGKK